MISVFRSFRAAPSVTRLQLTLPAGSQHSISALVPREPTLRISTPNVARPQGDSHNQQHHNEDRGRPDGDPEAAKDFL